MNASSTKHALTNLAAPTLLVQGMPDTPFKFDHAAARYRAFHAARTKAALFTQLEGHALNPRGFYQSPAPDLPFRQPGAAGSPCGSVADLTVAWFHEHLRGGAAADQAPVSFTVDNGACLELPAAAVVRATAGLTGPVTLPVRVGSVPVPVATPEDATRLVGQPVLRVRNATAVSPDDVAYVSLVAVGPSGEARTLSSQVTPSPTRPQAGRTCASVRQHRVAYAPGDEVALRLDRVNEFYWHTSGRVPGAVVLSDVALSPPVLSRP